jgi:hypothetical protein
LCEHDDDDDDDDDDASGCIMSLTQVPMRVPTLHQTAGSIPLDRRFAGSNPADAVSDLGPETGYPDRFFVLFLGLSRRMPG